jgi:hypothetical protein
MGEAERKDHAQKPPLSTDERLRRMCESFTRGTTHQGCVRHHDRLRERKTVSKGAAGLANASSTALEQGVYVPGACDAVLTRRAAAIRSRACVLVGRSVAKEGCHAGRAEGETCAREGLCRPCTHEHIILIDFDPGVRKNTLNVQQGT